VNKLWKNTVITKISAVVYVAPNTGRHIHKNRPYHGFVLNEDEGIKIYHFDDGRIMRTSAKELFYLPKGSSYHVETVESGGCYVINFDADICDDPFSVSFRNSETVLHNFRVANNEWRKHDGMRTATAMWAVYGAICQAEKEFQKHYISGEQASLIAPAVEVLNFRFTENDLSVSKLSQLCGISEVYFRRLFLHSFGVSPKEYMIQKRMDYAKTLLNSGDFSIVEIATFCGYAEPCHFSREFAKRVGVPPSRYLRK
jgi:AraC-like DNA-binding protein